MYVSTERGHLTVVKKLLDAGANIEITFQSGATPLYVAAQNNRVELVKLLVEKGANKLIKLKVGFVRRLQGGIGKNRKALSGGRGLHGPMHGKGYGR